MNKKIIPQLWFSNNALEAAELYVSIFENSSLLDTSPIQDESSGQEKYVKFILDGLQLEAFSAGSYFNFNTASSLLVHCESDDELEYLWHKLKEDGRIHKDLCLDKNDLMYGCLQDKFGLVWRFIKTKENIRQKITPCLLFSGDTQKALIYYEDIFENSIIKFLDKNQDNHLIYADFKIDDLELVCIDVEAEENPGFAEAFTFVIKCENQIDVNYYWKRLSYESGAEEFGWLKDKFGLSWHIVPKSLDQKLMLGFLQQREAVIIKTLEMKKIIIKDINTVYKESK